MKRSLLALVSMFTLLFGTATAQAHPHRSYADAYASHALVSGTVVSTDAAEGSFTADAYVVTPGAGGSSSMAATAVVTITTDSSTRINVAGHSGVTVGDMSAGETFYASFDGSSSDPLATLTASVADSVFAFTAPAPKAYVEGSIVSVNPSSDSFVVSADVVPSPSGGMSGSSGSGLGSGLGSGMGGGFGGGFNFAPQVKPDTDTTSDPTTTQVTITTDSNTKFWVMGTKNATIADLAAGQKFVADFDGSSADTLATLIASPALSVAAGTPPTPPTPHALYAFVGTVTGTDTADTPQTVTVDVTHSLPSNLVPSGSGAQTFTVDSSTLVFGGGHTSLFGGSLSALSPGDAVAGGLIGESGLTLTQVEGEPLKVLVDFPSTVSSTVSSAAAARAKAEALKRALKLLGQKGRKAKKRQHAKPSKQHPSRKHARRA